MTRCLVGLSSLLERARLGQDKVGMAKPLMVLKRGEVEDHRADGVGREMLI